MSTIRAAGVARVLFVGVEVNEAGLVGFFELLGASGFSVGSPGHGVIG